MELCIAWYCLCLYICNKLKKRKMKLENTKAQMRKGILEMLVLSIISKEPIYTSDIIKGLKEAELLVVEGTLYPLLTRLKNAGLLAYNWKESKAGPPRKYYEITDEGREFLDSLMETWNNLSKAVKKAIKTYKKDEQNS